MAVVRISTERMSTLKSDTEKWLFFRLWALKSCEERYRMIKVTWVR